MFNRCIQLIVFSIFLSGCSATVGPEINTSDVAKLEAEFERKSLDYLIDQTQRVNEIGINLVRHIPKEDIKVDTRPYLGIGCMNVDEATNRYFNKKEEEQGCFVAYVLKQSPADRAGIIKGDLLLKLNNAIINSPNVLVRMERKLKYDLESEIFLKRRDEFLDFSIMPEELPVDVYFQVNSSPIPNAFAVFNKIVVSYGLFNYAKTDEEIASVLAHELAHTTRNHITKSLLGGIIKKLAPKVSKDLEREADFYGVKYYIAAGYNPSVFGSFYERLAVKIPATMRSSIFSTHPGITERNVRIRSIIEEFQAK